MISHQSFIIRKSGFNSPPILSAGTSPAFFPEKRIKQSQLPINQHKGENPSNSQINSNLKYTILQPLKISSDDQNHPHRVHHASLNSTNFILNKQIPKSSKSSVELNTLLSKNSSNSLPIFQQPQHIFSRRDQFRQSTPMHKVEKEQAEEKPQISPIEASKFYGNAKRDYGESEKCFFGSQIIEKEVINQTDQAIISVIPRNRIGFNLASLKNISQNKHLVESQFVHSARILDSKENKEQESSSARRECESTFLGFLTDQKGNLKQFQMQYAVQTRAGQYSLNLQKINQDQSIISPFFSDKSSSLFGVCDGHGEQGHIVSNFVKNNLPKAMIKQIKSHGGWQNSDINLQKIMTKAFQVISTELLASNIDTFMSGTTAVTVLIHESALWCTNCGDSRAILGKMIGKGMKAEWKSIQLSEDHKPDLPREKKRITEHGGRVEKSHDSINSVFRVWNQTMERPGLAMSRSLGDKAGREVGVISEPDIYEILLKEEDKFIIIASDGVWEFLSNQDIIKIVVPFYQARDPIGAADAIMKASVASWQKNFFTNLNVHDRMMKMQLMILRAQYYFSMLQTIPKRNELSYLFINSDRHTSLPISNELVNLRTTILPSLKDTEYYF